MTESSSKFIHYNLALENGNFYNPDGSVIDLDGKSVVAASF